MRDIKFKAKRVEDGKWIVGSYVKRVINIQNEDVVFHRIIQINGKEDEILENTLSQFTGLFDVNQNEIYENDICSGHCDGNGIITYTDYNGGFEYIFKEGDNIDIFLIRRDIRIIGNRFDNLNLL